MPQRVLYLHGFGLAPELVTTAAGYLPGLNAAMPGCEIGVPPGFVTLDLEDPVTARIFDSPGNGLKSVARYANATGISMRC